MKKVSKSELPCFTVTQEYEYIPRDMLIGALSQILQEASSEPVEPMPHEHLWIGGGGKSDAWLAARLKDIKES